MPDRASVGDDGGVEIPDGLLGARVSLRHRVGERDGRPLFSDAVGELAADGPGGRAGAHPARAGPGPARRGGGGAGGAAGAARGGRRWPRWSGWRGCARTPGRRRSTAGWAGGGCGRRAGSPAGPTPRWPSATRAGRSRRRCAVRAFAARARDPGAGARAGRLALGPGGGRAGLDAGGRARGRSESARCWWRRWPTRAADPPGRAVRHGRRRTGGGSAPANRRPPAQRAGRRPGGPLRTAFALVRGPDGAPVGHLRAAVVEDHLHLALLAVAPAARRRGLARALVATAAAWGREHGARWAVLQVAVHNTDALASTTGSASSSTTATATWSRPRTEAVSASRGCPFRPDHSPRYLPSPRPPAAGRAPCAGSCRAGACPARPPPRTAPGPAATPPRPTRGRVGGASGSARSPVSSAARSSAAASAVVRPVTVSSRRNSTEPAARPAVLVPDPVLAGDRHQQQTLRRRRRAPCDTGSCLASAPPNPGTAATSVVNRPTRWTHQRVRLVHGPSRPTRACPAPRRRRARRAPCREPAIHVRDVARPDPGAQPERVGLAQPVEDRPGGPHERPQHRDDHAVRDRPVVARREHLRVVDAADAVRQPARHSQLQPPAAPRPPTRQRQQSSARSTASSASPPGPSDPEHADVTPQAVSGAAATRAGVDPASPCRTSHGSSTIDSRCPSEPDRRRGRRREHQPDRRAAPSSGSRAAQWHRGAAARPRRRGPVTAYHPGEQVVSHTAGGCRPHVLLDVEQRLRDPVAHGVAGPRRPHQTAIWVACARIAAIRAARGR